MNRTILSTALALTITAATFAQAPIERQAPNDNAPQQQQAAPDGQPQPPTHRHHPHNPHKQAAKLAERLNLTPDQTAKVEPILASRDEQMRNLMQNAQLTPEQRKHEMHQIQRNTQQQFAGVLTPDQMQQMRAMHREHHMHDGAQQPAAPVPQQS